MKTLVLKFDGLQSWGCQSKLQTRDTLDFPTLSGVIGILRAACGVYEESNNPLWDRFNELDMSVIIVENGRKQHDFCVAGTRGMMNLSGKELPGKKVTNRYFLSDAIFYVVVTGDDKLIDIIVPYLSTPENDLYMGRRCFPVNFDFFIDVYDNESLEDILKLLAKKEKLLSKKEMVLVVKESQDSDVTSQIVMDRPIHNKRFGPRKLQKTWIKTGVKNVSN